MGEPVNEYTGLAAEQFLDRLDRIDAVRSGAMNDVYVCNCLCHYPLGWRWERSQPRPQPRVFVPCEECDMVMHGPWDERPGMEAYITRAVDSPPMGDINITPVLTLRETLWQAFRHVYHQDHANAAMHCASVRYSPITFRLAEFCWTTGCKAAEVRGVLLDMGAYEEDTGR